MRRPELGAMTRTFVIQKCGADLSLIYVFGLPMDNFMGCRNNFFKTPGGWGLKSG
jgi:hypothetical protein